MFSTFNALSRNQAKKRNLSTTRPIPPIRRSRVPVLHGKASAIFRLGAPYPSAVAVAVAIRRAPY
ncbi:unnamed protein product [Penicillium roqueforti FM164]|uniref:Uncharacterized protein n=1 Tax=Penicillium roqueforti (strain FM164) TaxID=1365484 RepID=W6QK06_PENRF|nr:unnamed protein product [Penicillium roqueforti FM164]